MSKIKFKFTWNELFNFNRGAIMFFIVSSFSLLFVFPIVVVYSDVPNWQLIPYFFGLVWLYLNLVFGGCE